MTEIDDVISSLKNSGLNAQCPCGEVSALSDFKNPCFQCAGSQDSSPADTTGN